MPNAVYSISVVSWKFIVWVKFPLVTCAWTPGVNHFWVEKFAFCIFQNVTTNHSLFWHIARQPLNHWHNSYNFTTSETNTKVLERSNLFYYTYLFLTHFQLFFFICPYQFHIIWYSICSMYNILFTRKYKTNDFRFWYNLISSQIKEIASN